MIFPPQKNQYFDSHNIFSSGDTTVNWRVRVGSSFANSGGIVHSLTAIFIHPKFNQRIIDYDVSILRTTDVIEYGNVVQPAFIAGSAYNLPDNSVVWAAGWGTTSVSFLKYKVLFNN